MNYIKAVTSIAMTRVAPQALVVPERIGIANPDRRCLVVLLHGLNGRPADMEQHCQTLRSKHAIHCPIIYKRGNCTLDQAAEPIYRLVCEHICRHGPHAPIALIGISNGGRVAARVECMVRKMHPDNPVFLSTIATPFHGTKMLNWLGGVAGALNVYGPDPIEEMSFDSLRSRRLIDEMSEVDEDCGPRRYLFIAAERDMMVRPIQSALPTLRKGEKHLVIPDHGHISALLASRQRQCDELEDFLDTLS